MAMRLHVLKIATRFKMKLPKRFAARLKPVFGRTQVGGMWGAGHVADLGRALFEPLAEDITVVDELNHRGVVPDGCLEEVLQGGVCLPRLRPTILTFGV